MKRSHKEARFGAVKKKVILLLSVGIALSASNSMSKQWKILESGLKEWKNINRTSLKRNLLSLYSAKLIELRPKGDAFQIVLSHDGKKVAARFDLDNIKISDKKDWDGKWRIVLFDIPEKLKKVRNAIRFHFNKIGLVEYQKSVYIFPHPCEREIKFIAEFYRAHRFVRFVVADAIDDEEKFKKIFSL